MPPARRDVQAMVGALFTLIGSIERATRRRPGASALNLLQSLAGNDPVRPSEIADRQGVHPSLVTRQLKELEDQHYVTITQDPADGRAWLVSLTKTGSDEVGRLQKIGVDRFAAFVADWEPAEVRALTSLLRKLDDSKTAVARNEREGRDGKPGRRTEQGRPSGYGS